MKKRAPTIDTIGARVRRARGAVMVEYSFLLLAVGIPVMAAMAAGGLQMLEGYKKLREEIISPLP